MNRVRIATSTPVLGAVMFALVASLPFWLIQTRFILSVATLTLILMTASLGWNIISGYGGQISFGHSIFFGLGAYSTSILQVNYAGNAWLGILLGAAIAVLVGALLGWVTLRLKGIYFALATYALTLVFAILFGHFDFTGGEVGLTLPIGGNDPGAFRFNNSLIYYFIALVLVAMAFTVGVLVLRSRLGLQLRSIQADEDAARACGVRSFRVKLMALGISAAIAALAGALYAQYIGFIDPDSAFGANIATQIAVIAFVGGAGKVWGPVLGAVLLVPLQQFLNTELSPSLPSGLNLVIYAVVVLVVLWIEPRGLLSIRWRHRRGGPPPTDEATDADGMALTGGSAEGQSARSRS